MSITAAGCPSAAARLTSRPSASTKISRPSLVRWPSTNGRARNFSAVIASRSPLLISTSKWPELQTIAPDFITSNISPAIASRLPVTEMNTSPTRGGLDPGHHLVSVHQGLERPQRVDLADDHVGAVALGAHRHAAAAPAVADHDHAQAGDQDVRGPDHAIQGRLAGAVAVVEEVLRLRVVDGDDRVAELSLPLQRLRGGSPRSSSPRCRRAPRRAGRSARRGGCRPRRRRRPW